MADFHTTANLHVIYDQKILEAVMDEVITFRFTVYGAVEVINL